MAIFFAAWVQLCRVLEKRRERQRKVDLWEEMSLVNEYP